MFVSGVCVSVIAYLNDMILSAEEVKLENVELILEAFDYLQLPCALKEGNMLVSTSFIASVTNKRIAKSI